jgi:hypothetical protein
MSTFCTFSSGYSSASLNRAVRSAMLVLEAENTTEHTATSHIVSGRQLLRLQVFIVVFGS